MTIPDPIQHTSDRVLEFDHLRELLAVYAASPLGQQRIASLAPSRDRQWIERQHLLTEELQGYLRSGGRFDFQGLLDPTPLLSKSRIQGAALELTEIRDVLLLADRAAEWREIALHPPLITIRGERFVIPVKVEQRRRVQGVAHGASSSGQTVFLEPLETIEQNNELVRLHDEEQVEIHRILLEMTAKIGAQASALQAAVTILGELELQMAKARFAQEYDCVAVNLACDESVADASTESGAVTQEVSHAAFRLRNARHPLLERALKPRSLAVVPLSVELDDRHRQLIISGPNTGGKTVALKTIGLLVLMAQSGIPVPAERAELPIVGGVFADIGDYQSIEQNLSTFSAHVTNIDFISHHATSQSLVLLDELGSATDPEEGAALAVSIAEFFLQT